MELAGHQAPREAGEGTGRAAGWFGVPEVYALIALLSFLVARFVPVLDFNVECPLRALTSIPCATCGMTHAFVHLAHGQLAEALRWNPLGALLALGAWAYAVADLVRVVARRPLPSPPLRLVRGALWVGAAALAVNWVFLVVRGLGA